ncbi:rhamnan synthesis F family protein [Limoniibacter endophyticus]|uniref:rhamnan synthesis F family protein n=1 Tax=Limoniibacter endophyticus TaxID=1565040 RepID=UPI00167611A2|nr:rhamnan synthesis F family protein [Limoniibacter endophyticus]
MLAAKWFNKPVESSNIVETHDGHLHHSGNVYAIFLIWQPSGIPWYVRNALNALADTGVNVVLVINHPMTGDDLEEVKLKSKKILIRNNAGFDIGGFKDATLYCLEEFPEADRVIYLNDSTYFFENGLVDLFKRLADSKADVTGAFENWEIKYHIQSFCFSVHGDVFRAEYFRDFWINYLLIDSRLWAIKAGEIGLSRAIVPKARTIEILYSPNDLRAPLGRLSKEDLLALSRYTPAPTRLRMSDLSEMSPPEIIDSVIAAIGQRSQIHTGGFLYRRFLGCPLMKRDLLYRLQFTSDEIEQALREIGHEDHLPQIMTDVRRKGSLLHLPFLKKLQAASGIM